MKIQTKKQTVIARNVPPMRFIIAMFLSALLLAACGDDSENAGGTVEDGEVVAIVDKMISGVSQKGPFVNGSSVTVQELDGKTLAQTGLGFEGKIKNDLGEFTVKVNKLESQYALLKANGFYRNEVTGEKSKSQITLYALTDLSNRDEVNVNLLTHLAYERSLYLAMVDTLSVAKAKKQAEVEILNSFGIEGDFAAAEDLNIFGADDQSAALLAMSILMQSDLSEGDFSERLADYAADIESDGIWNDAKTATEIADWANALWLRSGLAIIRENIVKWDLSADVPAFEKYVNNFWWQNYGLGICDAKREGEVLKNQNTASVNADVYYICKSNLWQVASDIEKDTYKWLDSTTKRTEKDGDVRYGDVVATNCYVFEDKAWRSGNANDCSLNLRGCTKLRKDTVGKGSDSVWHVCHNRTWRNATSYEKDTFGWKDSTDGAIKKGNVTDYLYIFDVNKWRLASDADIKLSRCDKTLLGKKENLNNTTYVCETTKGSFEWKKYVSAGECFPSPSKIVKGSSVEWLFVSNSSVCSPADRAKGLCQLEWSFEGGLMEEKDDSVNRGFYSGDIFYSNEGLYYASLKISPSDEIIECSPLSVVNEMETDSIYYALRSGFTYTYSLSIPGFERMNKGYDSCGINLTDFDNPVINKDELCFDKNGGYTLFKITPKDTVAVLGFSLNGVIVIDQPTYNVIDVDAETGDVTTLSVLNFSIQETALAGEYIPIYISNCNSRGKECYHEESFYKKNIYALDYDYFLMKIFYKDSKGKMQPLLANERRIVDAAGIDTLYVTVPANNINGNQSTFFIGVKGQTDKLSITFKISETN